MIEEDVLLSVVEVGLTEFYAGATLCARNVDGTLVDAVVFESRLEEDPLGFEGGEVQG